MFDAIEPLVEAGLALHWLHPQEKRPIGDDWQKKPVATLAQLRQTYRKDLNLGVRLGEPSRIGGDLYLHAFDVDVRDPARAEEAFDALYAMIPEFEDFPEVASGSGGASRHFYWVSDRPFRGKKLRHSAGFSMVFDPKKGRDVKKWDYEIDLMGTGRQAVLPPSLHPATGLPYHWIRPFDWDLLAAGLGPYISGDRIAALAPQAAPAAETDEDDEFLAQVRGAPTDLTPEQIKETLSLLPLAEFCEDRDGWLQVGMALHHQFAGADEGLALWTEHAKQSKKFDPRDQKRVWKSFDSGRANGVRFPTLIQAAEAERERLAEVAAATDNEIDDLIGEAPAGVDPDAPKVAWRSLLEKNDEGLTKSTLHNSVLIVANDPRIRGLPALNLFTKEVVQRGAPGRYKMAKAGPKGCKQLTGAIWEVQDPINGDLWSEVRDVSVRDVLEAPVRQGGYAIKLTDRDLKGAVNLAARENAFHPVREYLSRQRWDGKARVESLFIDYLGAPDTPYTRSVARLFFAAAVTRVFEPGHKFDFAVMLKGLQGKRKSTFIQILARRWFAELDGDYHDPKSMVELMQGAWILELPDLAGFGRSDVRTIKAFISRTTDKVRLAYDRRADLFPRQCVFIGSTNDEEFLRDDTGGRRFWPIVCEVSLIDTDRLIGEVDQLWAEAYGIYLAMRRAQPGGTLPLYLADEDAAAEALKIQEMHRIESVEDGMAGRIAEWLDIPVTDDAFQDEPPRRRDQICLLQIWVECFGRDIANCTQTQSATLGRAMRRVPGWYIEGSRHRVASYGQQRTYRRNGSVGL
jgi:predicted P-loop ATPase